MLSNICVQLSDAELRIYFKLYEVFDKFGGNECHSLVFYNLETLTSERFFSTMKSVVTASLPVIIVMIYIVVKVIGYKGKEKAVFAKGLTLAAIILPYAALLFESVICMGNGFMTGFNLIPIMIVIAFASKGNKYVVKALDDIYAFAKAHPIVAVVAIIWLASYSAAFASDNKVFSLVTQFAM